MKYQSTQHNSPAVSLFDACINNIAPDGSYYLPEKLPILPRALFNNLKSLTWREIAYVVAKTFVGDEIEAGQLKNAIDDAFYFDVPLVEIEPGRLYALELFHGPTMTVKDIGARFMARLLPLLAKDIIGRQPLNVVVATTGNTGAAVANGFKGVKGVNVVALYPRGVLSRTQLDMLSTPGDNIYAVEVQGSVSDCRRLEEALLESHVRSANPSMIPISVHSANICRIISQIALYMHAYARLPQVGARKIVLSIPSGYAGNLTSAMMALQMGLPIDEIVASCNETSPLPQILKTSEYKGSPTGETRPLTPAINVTSDLNLSRIRHLETMPNGQVSQRLRACAIDDERVKDVIVRYSKQGRLFDPHTATAIAGLEEVCNADESDVCKIVLATAHPALMLDTMTSITGIPTELPVQLTRFMGGTRRIFKIAPTLPALKKFINTL